jgi:hypothetical protein
MATVSVWRDLKCLSLKAYAVVCGNGSFMMLAEDIVDVGSNPPHECRSFLCRRLRKLGIERGKINTGQVAVGIIYRGDSLSRANSAESSR